MNATATGTVDGAAQAGRAKGGAATKEAGPAEGADAFAGLLGGATPCAAEARAARPAEPGRGGAPEEPAPTARPTDEPGAEPGEGGEQRDSQLEATCGSPVLALLGLPVTPREATPTPAATAPAPQAPASRAARALAAANAGAGGGLEALQREALEDALRAATRGLETRGEARGTLTDPASYAALTALGVAGIGPADAAAATAAGGAPAAPASDGASLATASAAVADPQRARAGAPAPAAAPAAPATLQQPVGSPAWSDELGARLATLIDRGEQLATLQLTPDELGPVEVRIALREGEASVWFGAQAVETRAALEQALPRLRELFAAGGLALAHAAVNSDTPRDPQRALSTATLARARHEGGGAADEPRELAVAVRRGLLDLYA